MCIFFFDAVKIYINIHTPRHRWSVKDNKKVPVNLSFFLNFSLVKKCFLIIIDVNPKSSQVWFGDRLEGIQQVSIPYNIKEDQVVIESHAVITALMQGGVTSTMCNTYKSDLTFAFGKGIGWFEAEGVRRHLRLLKNNIFPFFSKQSFF